MFSRVHASLLPALSICPSVCPLVCPSIKVVIFLCSWAVFAILLLPKCMVNLFYHCPCPPARDLGSRVSGLVFYQKFILYARMFSSDWNDELGVKDRCRLHNKINHLTEKITGLNSGRACAHLIGMIN